MHIRRLREDQISPVLRLAPAIQHAFAVDEALLFFTGLDNTQLTSAQWGPGVS